MLIDIPFLREQCQDYLNGCDWPIDNDVPRAFIRILDAFEAMDKLGCDLVWWDDYGEPVVFKNGETLLEVFLNSAAATLEDKSDG